MNSLDPRMTRLDLQQDEQAHKVQEHEYWPTYEVFVQAKRGKRFEHVGSLHAADPEVALVLAKEQYGRRQTVVNMWVVKTTDVFALNYENEDMFSTNMEKTYREASGFKSRDRIEEYKKRIATNAE